MSEFGPGYKTKEDYASLVNEELIDELIQASFDNHSKLRDYLEAIVLERLTGVENTVYIGETISPGIYKWCSFFGCKLSNEQKLDSCMVVNSEWERPPISDYTTFMDCKGPANQILWTPGLEFS
jgi:hypothetical protein